MARLERRLRAGLEPLRESAHVGDVRVIGGVGVVELVQDKRTRSVGGYLDRVGPLLAEEFLRRNLLLRPLGNIVYFMPPYAITEDQADWALNQIAEVISSWTWPGS